jgi:hypothetical protein
MSGLSQFGKDQQTIREKMGTIAQQAEQIKGLEAALQNIVTHQEAMAGDVSQLSGAGNMARAALIQLNKESEL